MRLNLLFGVLFCLLLFAGASPVLAGNITFSLEQKEYYFTLGEQAVVDMDMNNTYGKEISGQMSHTMTQTISQQGFQYTSTNSQSSSFSVASGENTVRLDFGTTNQPTSLDVSLRFDFTENGSRTVNIDGLKIHFVENSSQQSQQNQQAEGEENSMQSSSQQSSSSSTSTSSSQQNSQTGQQGSQSSQQSGSQQSGSSQTQQPTTSTKVQNNQLNQNMGAVKQQMQEQVAEQEEMEQNFQEALELNPDFQTADKELKEQGYTQQSKSLNPSANDTGEFAATYKNEQGETATLSGKMENGTMSELMSQTEADRQEMLNDLTQNQDFQEFEEMLGEMGFNRSDVQFDQISQNETEMKISYQTATGGQSEITAKYSDGKIDEVKLEKDFDENQRSKIYLWIALLLLLTLVGGYLYFRQKRKSRSEELLVPKKPVPPKPVDYRKVARKMLAEAEQLFSEKQEKDAYEKVSQAVRFYFSHNLGFKRDITNSELLSELRKANSKDSKKVQECLGFCGMVEFAKYVPNKADFERCKTIAERIILPKELDSSTQVQ